MKLILAALATLATAVVAQDINTIPQCAIPCLDDAVTRLTDCKTTEYPCICDNLDKIQSDSTTVSCVVGACTNITQVISAAQNFCAQVEASASASGTVVVTTTLTQSSLVIVTSSSVITSTDSVTSSGSSVSSGGTTTATATLTSTFTSGSSTFTRTTTSTSTGTNAAPAVGPIGGFGMFLLGLLAL